MTTKDLAMMICVQNRTLPPAESHPEYEAKMDHWRACYRHALDTAARLLAATEGEGR